MKKNNRMAKLPNDFYKFCPKCGGALTVRHREELDRLVCTVCDFTFYQNPKAVVLGLIVNDRNEVLMAKRALNPEKGKWDIPGGFIDFGEEPLHAIVREMREECHVEFTPTQCLGVYKGWYDFQGLQDSHAVIYYIGTIKGNPEPDDDVDEVRWFPLDALPKDLAFDHIRLALADYMKLQRK